MPQQEPAVPLTRALRALLQEMRTRGLNQSSLARALATKQGTVQPWLTRQSRPSERYKQRCFRVFGIPTDDWLTADEYREIYGQQRHAS